VKRHSHQKDATRDQCPVCGPVSRSLMENPPIIGPSEGDYMAYNDNLRILVIGKTEQAARDRFIDAVEERVTDPAR
jgi:hypothetical protein